MIRRNGHVTKGDLHHRLTEILSPSAMAWLEEACEAVGPFPSTVLYFSATAGLQCGQAPLGPDLDPWTVDDAARTLILTSLRLEGPPLAETIETVYRRGDDAERRAVLRALPLLPIGADLLHLVKEALNTGNPRLIAAALGPYAAEHLDQPAWRDGVFACLLLGIPLIMVADLHRRIDPDLIVVFGDHAAQYRAADRPVPADLREAMPGRDRTLRAG
ncbi:EboA domain-containing protein [Thermomonospora umbrina]|uniref:Uncharacterized protein n=1 Tax=Thermomonospora umbrina TaxID=111806 RepID=A0A3D9SGJ3_9ACTN|nr:EboA domain-containing protein [Thermomonospora umbrina]REE95022.1 hypothetical protein DFJ69_0393 [Thermomonospora umbrina]